MKNKKLWIYLSIVLIIYPVLLFTTSFFEYSKFQSGLRQLVYDRCAASDYEIAVYVNDLSPGFAGRLFSKNHIAVNPRRGFPAASVIKLPILAAVYLADRKGKIDINEVYKLKQSDKTGGSGMLKSTPAGREYTYKELLSLMVSKSDNTAANIFVEKLGFDYLNKAFADLGCLDTVINRRVCDLRARDQGIRNIISARDAAYLLEEIYRRRCVDREASEHMMQLLLNQEVDDRIPRYLPEITKVANKTGTIRGVVHDVGIIFVLPGDFILCVLTEGAPGYAEPKEFIGNLSYMIYNFWVYLK